MKNILVPTDFSKASHNAARYAISLAEAFQAEVTLVNVVIPPIIVDDSVLASVMITQAEIVEINRKLMEKEIETLSKQYSNINGFIEEGYLFDIIPKWIALNQVGLTVMGMKGKGKSNSVFGSNTTSVIRKLSFPVFVIPEKADYKPISYITFASDFDADIELDRYALLSELAKKFNSQINILNVQKKASELNAEKVIGKMKASLAFSKLNHRFHSINEKNVEKGINKFIEKNPTDILAMVAHRHNFIERVFGKVHTKSMSYQTKIPLLVLQSK